VLTSMGVWGHNSEIGQIGADFERGRFIKVSVGPIIFDRYAS